MLSETLTSSLVAATRKHGASSSVASVDAFAAQISTDAVSLFDSMRNSFFNKQDTTAYLGFRARNLYRFIRGELKVPFHRGLVEHPTVENGNNKPQRERKTIGSWISIIYAAIRGGRMQVCLAGCFQNSELVN